MKKQTLLLLDCCTALVSAAGQNRPNIVFIYGDDVGYGDLGPYGATAVKTPNRPTVHDRSALYLGLRQLGHLHTFEISLDRHLCFPQEGTGVLPCDAARS